MNDFKNASKKMLTPEAYTICWNKGTERPFTGAYNAHYETGQYHCVCCETFLFDSDKKFDSGTGWPSFWESSSYVVCIPDHSHSMTRMEVRCKTCGSHLGHVFKDGPFPSGKRYCINSAALQFKKIPSG